MPLPHPIHARLEQSLGAPLRDIRPVGGGDIHTAVSFTAGRRRYFLKFSQGAQAADMLQTEARSLSYLAKACKKNDCTREYDFIPRPLATEKAGDYACLLLPYIAPGTRTKSFWEQFGRALARLHRIGESAFGFPFDNYIGRLPQSNRRHERWHEFYARERLLPQARMAADAGLLSAHDMQKLEALLRRLPEWLPEEPPSLIHGDLWSGNFLCDTHARPRLIDPAPCYAHREMDLAMSKLFGGFHPHFYEAYAEAFPLLPGYGRRTKIYQLYYLLVHLNLFGKGYHGAVMEAMG